MASSLYVVVGLAIVALLDRYDSSLPITVVAFALAPETAHRDIDEPRGAKRATDDASPGMKASVR